MSGKITFSVHDDVHNQKAEGIEYDLWRINNNTNRVNIKHDTITNDSSNVLVQANTNEDLGSFEVVLYIKDYFERLNPNLDVQDSRFVVPFGMNELNRDYHLNVHITPTGYTCTL
jgi:5-hydroxyisourate hydrolase-like protein (transthyretin family)